MSEFRHEIWLGDARGNRIMPIKAHGGFSVTRIAGEVGSWYLDLPGDFPRHLARLDSIVEFWRAPAAGALKWFSVGMVRDYDWLEGNDGNDILRISGPDPMDLIDRRIVAYAAGTAQAAKTGPADNLMKAVIRENQGSLASAARNYSSLGFTVQPDFSLGPTISRGFSWTKVITALRRFSDSAREAGTEVYYEVVPAEISQFRIGFEFRTYINQLGQDRREDVIFSKEYKNLARPHRSEYHRVEVNYVYAGGSGEKEDRPITERSDPARIGASVWNRREAFADARGDADAVSKAEERLSQGRPRNGFRGRLLDTPQTSFGKDWDFGDRVTVAYQGWEGVAMVNNVTWTVSSDNNETIDARAEVYSE